MLSLRQAGEYKNTNKKVKVPDESQLKYMTFRTPVRVHLLNLGYFRIDKKV